jgi:hypothetical protein
VAVIAFLVPQSAENYKAAFFNTVSGKFYETETAL